MKLKTCVCGVPTVTGRCSKHPLPARARGNAFEPTRMAVAARDGWVCQLCFESIDPTLRKPDPRALNVHHVRGRGRGGSDVPANLVASHAICNQQAGVT